MTFVRLLVAQRRAQVNAVFSKLHSLTLEPSASC